MSNDPSLNEINSQISRISDSKRIKFQTEYSVKSTESVDHCDIHFFYDNIETLEQDAEHNESIHEPFSNPDRVRTLGKYRNYFLLKEDPNKLLSNYIKEKSRLVRSATKNLDFGIKEVLLRLKSGYTVVKYKRKKKLRVLTKIKVEDSLIKIKSKKSNCYKRIPFECIFGVILGCEAVAFKRNKEKLDLLCGEMHENFECFSIITDKRSHDLACYSDLPLYDLCIGISWISYHYSPIRSSIPFSKFSLSVSLISLKLEVLASSRYMSIVELFMLAICKTLKDLKRNYLPVLNLLNRRFNGGGKVYRLISRSILPILSEHKSKENLKNCLRATLLASSAVNEEKNLDEITQALQMKNKNTLSPFNFVAFFVPSDSSIFNKVRKDRSKVNFSYPSTSIFSSTIRRSSKVVFK